MKLYNTLKLTLILLIVFSFSCTHYTMVKRSARCINRCTSSKNPEKVIRCLTRAINRNPEISSYYFYRGKAYYQNFLFSDALMDFKKVIQLEPGNIKAFYYLASTASLSYHRLYALYWLEKCFEAGFADAVLIEKDPALDNLRDMDEFKHILKKWDVEPITLK